MSGQNSTFPRMIEIGDVIPVSIQVDAVVIDRTSGIITLQIMKETVPDNVLRGHRSLWSKSPRKTNEP